MRKMEAQPVGSYAVIDAILGCRFLRSGYIMHLLALAFFCCRFQFCCTVTEKKVFVLSVKSYLTVVSSQDREVWSSFEEYSFNS